MCVLCVKNRRERETRKRKRERERERERSVCVLRAKSYNRVNNEETNLIFTVLQ